MQVDDSTTPAPPPVTTVRRPSRLKWTLFVIVLLVAAYLAAYIPATLRTRRFDATLRTTRLDLQLATLHRHLGVASHEAQRNNFAAASAAARAFFDGCRTLSATEPFANEPRTRAAISAYANARDEIITQLATADPQVRERLAGMYLTMDGVLNRRQ